MRDKSSCSRWLPQSQRCQRRLTLRQRRRQRRMTEVTTAVTTKTTHCDRIARRMGTWSADGSFGYTRGPVRVQEAYATCGHEMCTHGYAFEKRTRVSSRISPVPLWLVPWDQLVSRGFGGVRFARFRGLDRRDSADFAGTDSTGINRSELDGWSTVPSRFTRASGQRNVNTPVIIPT